MNPTTNKIDYKSFIRELLIVTIGVCIGMMLNTWNQKRVDKNQSNQYLDGIVEELKDNSKNVEKSLKHHQDLYKTLRENPDEANLVLSPALLRDVAWELSKTNIFKENIPQELYLNIAHVYSIQEELEKLGDQATDRMSEINILGPYYLLTTLDMDLDEEKIGLINTAMTSGWKAIFESWIATEDEYIKEVEKILNRIKK